MKSASAFTLALFVFASAAAGAQKHEVNYANFTVPGSSTSVPAGFYGLAGTVVQDMNASGEIIGYYTTDSSIPTRGFKRERNGKITLIDDPRAGVPVSGGSPTPANTRPNSINDAGTIVGSSSTSFPITQGFILNRQGNFEDFLAPANSGWSEAISINAKGVITGRSGQYGPSFGFIRKPNGETTAFQAPDADLTGILQGTTSLSINSNGATTGYYYDANSVAHSYVRAADGTFTDFEVPGAGINSFTGTWPIMIDDEGTVLGFYADDNWMMHSYIRLADGSFVQVSLPDPEKNNQVFVDCINRHGDIAGSYTDAGGVYHTYIRLKNGTFVYFTDPEAGTGPNQGTVPLRVNESDEVAGYYIDANNVYHGFVWKVGRD